MTDTIPNQHNRLAHALGYILHPFALFFVGVYLLLRDLAWWEMLAWMLLAAALTIIPTFLMMRRILGRGQHIYQREVRGDIYRVAWLSLLLCVLVLLLLDAPVRLIASTVAGLVWLPLQQQINQRYTKISGHAAFSMGVIFGLWYLGELASPISQGLGVGVLLLTAWARYVTQHHSWQQIVLGWLVALVSVGLTFALIQP